MRESPRIRRLRSDRAALEKLQAESTIFQFTAAGNPADYYQIRFSGRGLWLPQGGGDIRVHDRHEVHVRLGASYPRMMPEIAWKTPIYHPNISASGVVCLGGYGTYWVPSLTLDELCTMLWDMVRYENYDEKSPYNRDAANWIRAQEEYRLPVDPRPLRDRLAGYAPRPAAVPPRAQPLPVARAIPALASPFAPPPVSSVRTDATQPALRTPQGAYATSQAEETGVVFIDTPRSPALAEVVEATVVDDTGIVFIN